MLKQIKLVIYITLLLLICKNVSSQNYYNAPYSRFIIGDILNSGFAYNRSLGGSSIAIRPKNQVNYLNPASYTAQDTNSFLLHIGFTGRYAEVFTNLDNDESVNFNIDYFSIGFPLKKWCNMSIGVTPFSRIQYFVREETDGEILGEQMAFDYKGFGGFNEFYIGTAFEFGNLVSVGANFSYLFGSLNRTQSSYLTEHLYSSTRIDNKQSYIAGDLYYKLGIQIHPVIKENHYVTLGLTYDLESDIKVKLKDNTMRYHNAVDMMYFDTLLFKQDTLAPLVLPSKLGIGLTYSYKDIFTVTGEYSKQDWSGTNIDNSYFSTGKYESFRFGLEFYPAPLKVNQRLNYFDRIRYRIGGRQINSYLNYGNRNISTWGLSAGLGLPIKNSRKIFSGTTFNIGYSFDQRGTTNIGLIKEKIHVVTFGLTLHDFWFLKPKYD
jgi:hypothetical protein